MPNRIIREGILDSAPVNTLSWGGEVFYRRLMSKVDDYGRYDARLAVLRANLYPLLLAKVSEADVSSWLAECEEAGLVSQYEVDGKPYLVYLKLDPSRQAKTSKWPPPPADASARNHAHTRASARLPLTEAKSKPKAQAQPEAKGEGARGSPGVSPGCADGISDSVSPEPPEVEIEIDDREYNARRQSSRLRYRLAVAKLFAPSATKQYRSDKTTSEQLFDEVWSDDIGPRKGEKRIGELIELCQKAHDVEDCPPMRWFVGAVKRRLEREWQ